MTSMMMSDRCPGCRCLTSSAPELCEECQANQRKPQMSKLSLIAASMWQEEARRTGTLSVAAQRTYEAFENEATELQDKWIGYAKVALKTIEDNTTF